MKSPIEFSSRKVGERVNLTATKEQGTASQHMKTPFKTEIINQDVSARRSPDFMRNYPEVKSSCSYNLTNLKCEIQALKQEASRITNTCHQPLEFKQKTRDHGRNISNCENRETANKADSFKFQPLKSLLLQDQAENRKQLDKMRQELTKKQIELAEQQKKITKLQGELRTHSMQSQKQREQLEGDVEMARSTNRQFRQQVERLKEQLKQVGQRERQMVQEKKDMLQRVNNKRNEAQQRQMLQRRYQEATQQLERMSIDKDSTIQLLKKDIEKCQRQHEIDRKHLEEQSSEIIRRKDKEISLLKQQINILQQLTSTRLAEQNCLVLQKEAVQKLCQNKDIELKRLQKQILDLKERLENQRNFSDTISQKLNTKDILLQKLQNQLEITREQARSNNGASFHSMQLEINNLRTFEHNTIQQYRVLSDECQKLKNKEKNLSEELRVMRLKDKNNIDTILILREQLQKLHIVQRNLLDENLGSRQREARLQKQLRQIKEQLEKCEVNLQKLRVSEKNLTQSLRQLKEKEAYLQTDTDKIREDADKTKKQLQIQSKQLHKTQQNLEKSQKNLHKAEERLNKFLEVQQNIQQQNKIRRVKEVLCQEETNRQNEHVLKKVQLQNRKLVQDIHQSKVEIQKLQQLLKSVESQLESYKREHSRVREDQSKARELNQIKIENSRLQKQNTKLQEEHQKMQCNFQKMLSKDRKQTGTLTDKTPEIENLHKQLIHRDEVINGMRNQIVNMEHHLNEGQIISRRLRRTEELLIDTNDLLQRRELAQLSKKMQEKYRQIDE